MKTQEARELGQSVAAQVEAGQTEAAYALLAPVLAQRTPFRLLDLIGRSVGAGPLEPANAFLDRIAAGRTEGGWAVVGSALGQQVNRDLAGALARCRTCIVAAGVWYGADILGERVPGPALVGHFEPTLEKLAPWREDPNHWVRRTVGVGVHFWAKRSRGAPELVPRADALLAFLEPMFEEQDTPAIKGVGWGLKTLGKHYPAPVTDWLVEQVTTRGRRPRTLMLRKATTYLSDDQPFHRRGTEDTEKN